MCNTYATNGGIMSSTVSIESTKSKITALKKVHDKKAKLNKHRCGLLNRVPNDGDYEFFAKGHVTIEDLAYLTACTGCEFALLKGKKNDVLFHGGKYNCSFDKVLSDSLKSHKYKLYAHSHPDEDNPVPSVADRNTLEAIGQDHSLIISATTLRITRYSNNQCLDYLL